MVTDLRNFCSSPEADDNAVIQIKGDLSFNDAKKLSADARKNNGIDIVAGQK